MIDSAFWSVRPAKASFYNTCASCSPAARPEHASSPLVISCENGTLCVRLGHLVAVPYLSNRSAVPEKHAYGCGYGGLNSRT